MRIPGIDRAEHTVAVDLAKAIGRLATACAAVARRDFARAVGEVDGATADMDDARSTLALLELIQGERHHELRD